MRRTSLTISLVLLALVGGAVVAFKALFPPKSDKNAAATPVTQTVAALGRIRPRDGIIDIGADATVRVGKLLVAEGDTVEKGKILAYLDTYPEMQASANYAESQLQGGKAQFQARTEFEQANIARSQTEVKHLEVTGPRIIQIQQMTIDKLRVEQVLAQKESDRYDRMYKQSSASREDVDRKSTELVQRTKAVETAEAELSKLQAAFPLDLAKARHNLASAKANLKVAQATVDLPALARNVDLAKARLERTLVRAPSAGRILKIRTFPGETPRNQVILTMANLEHIFVVAEVYESDLLRVKEGQQATITAPALPEPLTGAVVFVNRLVNKQTVFDLDPAAATDARVAEVRIRLARPDPAARLLNLQVAVEIHVDEKGAPP